MAMIAGARFNFWRKMIMKKVFLAISMLAVAFGFTACSNEDEAVNNAKKGKATVVAFTENETRTALSGSDTEGYQVVWSEGDKITIGTETFDIDEKSIAGTTAKFTGNKLDEDTYTALYGINEMVWPSKQTYKEGNVANFPMYAEATVDAEGNISPLQFKNLGGLLKLTVKGEKVIKKIEIESADQIAGTISKNKRGNFILAKPTLGQAITTITLDCGDGVKLTESGTDFYIALFAKSYTNVSIRLYDTDGTICLRTLKSEYSLAIDRSQITKASFSAKNFDKKAITKDSPVGFVGLISSTEGIVVKLGDKNVVIATKNVGATTIDGGAGSENIDDASCYGTLVDKMALSIYDESAFGGAGWRLPTVGELTALSGNMEWNSDRHGVEWKVTKESTLYMPAAGAKVMNPMGNPPITFGDVGNMGYYWSSLDDTHIFVFGEKEKSLNRYSPLNTSIKYYYRIRAFHDMPTE